MPLTINEAKALRLRLESGESWIDHNGQERSSPTRRKVRKVPNLHSLPSVESLMVQFQNCHEASYSGLPTVEQFQKATSAALGEDAERNKHSIAASVANMMAGLKTRAERRLTLPCYELDPLAHDGEGRDDLATAACESIRAYRECAWSTDLKTCPRARMDAAFENQTARISRAGVPQLFAEPIARATPGWRQNGTRCPTIDLEDRPAIQLARAWLSRIPAQLASPYAPFRGNEALLVLCGHAGGEGKSMAGAFACAIEREESKWVAATDLALTPISAYEPEAFLLPTLLIVDDAGTEPVTEWNRSRLYDILARRHAAKRRTLITTNIASRPDFCARYDERLDRRITEAGRWMRLEPWTSR